MVGVPRIFAVTVVAVAGCTSGSSSADTGIEVDATMADADRSDGLPNSADDANDGRIATDGTDMPRADADDVDVPGDAREPDARDADGSDVIASPCVATCLRIGSGELAYDPAVCPASASTDGGTACPASPCTGPFPADDGSPTTCCCVI